MYLNADRADTAASYDWRPPDCDFSLQIGEDVLVGMGVTINLRVKIGSRARIGNGATVKSDVPEDVIVRAGTTWPG